MFVFHEQCLALSSQILGQYCYCFCLISESTSQKLKYLSTNVEMDSVVHFSVCCRERKFNKNLIKFHLRENQFFGLKVIQLIRAYVGSAYRNQNRWFQSFYYSSHNFKCKSWLKSFYLAVKTYCYDTRNYLSLRILNQQREKHTWF